MSSVAQYLIAALGLAVLMVVHEGGHYLAARRFGMRVTKFSIGFGPTLWRHRPKGSPTVYQVAIIPFLAYVQIAGMNPYEDIDPKDKGSYANASLWGRIVTIAAGPVANYLFASILLFAGLLANGRMVSDEASLRVSVIAEGPAKAADMRDGDRLLSINGQPLHSWEEIKKAISAHPGEELDVHVDRGGQDVALKVTPGKKGEKYEGKILIEAASRQASYGEVAMRSLTDPPKIVVGVVVGLARIIARIDKPDVVGPLGIVKETAARVRLGAAETFQFLGALSAYLGGFNLLPFPALDGGRLLFLGFEAVSRRKADAKVEAGVHAVGLIMLITLIAFVTYVRDLH